MATPPAIRSARYRARLRAKHNRNQAALDELQAALPLARAADARDLGAAIASIAYDDYSPAYTAYALAAAIRAAARAQEGPR